MAGWRQMQVTEANTEGLKRTLKVVVGADELGRRFSERLDEIKDRVQLKGFRKGKVPVPHLKKMYGRSLMAEVLEQTVKETSSKAIADRNERAVMQPSYTLPEDEKEIEQVLEGKADLAYSMTFEVLPELRSRRPQDAEARTPARRRRARRHRQGGRAAGRAQHHLHAGGGPRGRLGRPRHHGFRRQDRRRGVRGRLRRGHAARARPGATSSPASRKASSASRPARSATSTRPSPTTTRSTR